MKVLLIANVPTHYRVPLYAELARRFDFFEVVFYSDGGEWYWKQMEATPAVGFENRRLPGLWIGKTRLTRGLARTIFQSDADVIIKDPNGKFVLPLAYIATRLSGKPFVFWASLWKHPTTRVHRISRPLSAFIYRHADAIVTYGRHVTRHVIESGAAPDRVVEAVQAVIPPPWVFPAEGHDWREHGRTQVLFVGRLERWKGVDLLLEAAVLVPGVQLTIAGDGPERSALESLCRQRGLGSRTHFLGRVPNADLHKLYRRAAAVVIPSVQTPSFSEPWALVANEAMHNRCLVIASSAVGAVRDGLLTHDVTGLVFEEGESASLAAQLARLTDPAELKRLKEMADDGGLACDERHTFAKAADGFVSAVNIAISGRGARI